MRRKKLNILMLSHFVKNDANVIREHCKYFQQYSMNKFYYFDPVNRQIPKWLNLNKFNSIVIHWSIYSIGQWYLDDSWIEAISSSKALKVMFIQDEYRKVNAFTNMMRHLRINILYTCVPQSEINKVYPEEKLPNVKKINTLTGYVPEYFYSNKPKFDLSERPLDVIYRGRVLGYWYGALAQEKILIAEQFLKHNKNYNLNCDISYRENDRVYGKKWLEFIGSSKTSLATESGASVFDMNGLIESTVRNYMNEQDGNPTFEEVREIFFKDQDGKIKLNQISPRIFESIGCGTVLVMFEGEYSNIVEPDTHYIPLKKDFSNIASVVDKINDTEYLMQIAKRVYQDVIQSRKYSYQSFVEQFDQDIMLN